MRQRNIAISTLFAVAAIYDGILGFAFLLAAPALFQRFDVAPPNHWGYVQFSAALLIIFAAMFLNVARRPRQNRNLIPYAVFFKIAYCAVVFGNWFTRGLPSMWIPLAFADAVFALLFAWAYWLLADDSTADSTGAVSR